MRRSKSQEQGMVHPQHMIAANLLERCNRLVDEYNTYRENSKNQGSTNPRIISHYFKNTLLSEQKTLTRINSQDNACLEHIVRRTAESCNLPFLEAVWETFKNTRDVQAVQKQFYWQRQGDSNKQNSILIDVVADNGMHWLNVSLLTNKRLSHDKRKQEWNSGNEDTNSIVQKEIPIIRKAHDLLHAAQNVHVRGGNIPYITLVLPKIQYGESPEIDDIITYIRQLGIQVLTAPRATIL